jgi:hypothetical protein
VDRAARSLWLTPPQTWYTYLDTDHRILFWPMPWRTSHVQSEAIHAYLDMSSNKLTPFLTLVTDPDPELDLVAIFSVPVCTFYEPVDSPSSCSSISAGYEYNPSLCGNNLPSPTQPGFKLSHLGNSQSQIKGANMPKLQYSAVKLASALRCSRASSSPEAAMLMSLNSTTWVSSH